MIGFGVSPQASVQWKTNENGCSIGLPDNREAISIPSREVAANKWL